MTVSKRYSAAHKTALNRVAQHLKLAAAAHDRGMNSLASCAKSLVDAKKLSKAADDGDLASHLPQAHGHFGKAASSMDDAEAHLSYGERCERQKFLSISWHLFALPYTPA